MDSTEQRLLNDYQQSFPLNPRPFREIGKALGIPEQAVITLLNRHIANGTVSRVGTTFVPGRVGAAMLGALAVPDARLLEVAELVNAYPEINHNYEREHAYNLWFVATGENERDVESVVREIQRIAGCGPALFLPAVESYHVDLGFDLAGVTGGQRSSRRDQQLVRPIRINPAERALLVALQDGLPLRPAPYAELARCAGIAEADVIKTLERWLQQRLVNRFGVIVNHRQLGYQANAMAVWDVPNQKARSIGRRIAAFDFVTLCQRRLRHLPYWRYNLYCLIHGTDREKVAEHLATLRSECGLDSYPEQVLFSRQCFRQRGARYFKPQSAGVRAGRPREPALKRLGDRLLSRLAPGGLFSPKRS